ncbi:MAG: head GIN domain-containing protein [Bacteroidota bacterium]
MKNIHSIFMLLIPILLFTACEQDRIKASEVIISEERSIETFEQVTIEGIANIYLEYGENTSLIVEADDNIIDKIKTSSDGRTLRIETDFELKNYDKATIDVYVTNPNLTALVNEGVGDIRIEDFEDLKELRIMNEGVGNIEVSGIIEELRLNTSGVGEFKGFNCNTKICIIQQSSVGNTEVKVSEELSGKLSGVGNIYYKGNPEVNVERSGVGTVIDAN